jgi:hypothetical protein
MSQAKLLPLNASWYERVFGFPEGEFAATRAYVNHAGVCPPPQQDPITGFPRYRYLRHGTREPLIAGHFETPSVEELRQRVATELDTLRTANLRQEGAVRITNIVGESRDLHTVPEFTGAVFQAASQFNCLEFADPTATPELGITYYFTDKTQGPACALAAAAGLQFRQHSVKMKDGTIGQTAANQINTLCDIEEYIVKHSDSGKVPWTVSNGYMNSTAAQLKAFETFVTDAKHAAVMRGKLRIGVQWDTQVTAAYDPNEPAYLVTQTYNSAVSVGYSSCGPADWQHVARLVLEASYEATFLVGVLNNCYRLRRRMPPRPVLLTKLGGGVFQNEATWIQGAIRYAQQAVTPFNNVLTCHVVHYAEVEAGYESAVASSSL